MTKTLDVVSGKDAQEKISDIKFFGNPDLFRLISKASSEMEEWMKSTKAMEIAGVGCVVQVSTLQRNPDNSYSVAEAVTFVPGVYIHEYGGKFELRETVK